jgi:hypothetical protein
MNFDRPSDPILHRRGNEFSLSPGERAGVRVSVKLFSPRSFQSFKALNLERGFRERIPRTISIIEPMNHSQIQRRAIAKTRKPILPLLGGEGRGEGGLLNTKIALRFMVRVSVNPFSPK